jgi:hypothetical protein
MAYGFQLRKATDNTAIDQNLTLYGSARNGISTSDPYYFETINFTGNLIYLSMDNLADYLPSSNLYSANTNFDLINQNFIPKVRNLSKPTIVKICDVDSYETSNTNKIIISSGLKVGSQILSNYSSPSTLQTVIALNITQYATSKLNTIVNSNYIQQDNFAYVKYYDSLNNFYKYFLLSFNSGSANWIEIPDESFYNYVDFYITISTPFNGVSLNIALFQNITISRNQTILINCQTNDSLSGLYTIDNITSTVFLKKGNLFFNYIGQTFFCDTNIDFSSSTNRVSCCYYVPYTYGNTSEVFSKNLNLTKFINSISSASNYLPLICDSIDSNNSFISSSTFLIPTNKAINLSKFSDQFIIAMGVGTYLNDGTFFSGSFNIQINEGF